MESPGKIEKTLLKATEYLADNAYVAPGFHRLFTATSLALGLGSGRKVMDYVTARRNADGTEIKPEDVPFYFKPIYARMRYNPYSDDPHERWKLVADKFVPMGFGILGAWAGSQYFFHGKDLDAKPFHGPSALTQEQVRTGKTSMQAIDSAMMLKQSDQISLPSAVQFGLGGAEGGHILGAIWPFGNGVWSAMRFQLGHERKINMPVVKTINRVLFGNRSLGSGAIRPAMVDAGRWVESNLMQFGAPENWLKEEDLRRHVQNGLQNFRDVTPEMEANVRAGFHEVIDAAYKKMEALRATGMKEAEVSKTIRGQIAGDHAKSIHDIGFSGQAFDNLLHQRGVPLEKAEVGGRDMFSFLGRLLGSGNGERQLEQQWSQHLKKTYNIDYGPTQLKMSPWKAATAWGAAGVGITATLTAGTAIAQNTSKRIRRTDDPIDTDGPGPLKPGEPNTAKAPESGFTHWLNGKPLDVMQWSSRILLTPPSMHRLMNAAYLSAALFGGMKVADLLAGRELKLLNAKGIPSSEIAKESVTKAFQPLHGLLSYTPGSVASADRWKQSAHYLIPVLFGAAGTYTGSKQYFKKREEKLKNPETLEDYTDKIAMEQSKTFGAMTAITSIVNTGSGLHLMPFFSYSSNMHNRFLLASGTQVAMPGIGKWWSGNAGLTPWGVKKSLTYISNYLANNPDPRPIELPSLVHSVLGKLYPDLPDDELVTKKQVILNRIHEVRDSYLVDGHVPEAKRADLQKAMTKLVTGEGFEDILLLAGLNPADANLAANGASGKLANALGRREKVDELQQQYRDRYAERISKNERMRPSEYLHSLANRSAEHADRMAKNAEGAHSANDNTTQPTNVAEHITREGKLIDHETVAAVRS